MTLQQKSDFEILVIGQKPPPIHGANVMTEMLIEALKVGSHKFRFIEKRLSDGILEVGRLSSKKILRWIVFFARTFQVLLRREKSANQIFIYIVSVAPVALAGDMIMLWLVRVMGGDYVLYIHGRGFASLAKGSQFWNRQISSLIKHSCGQIVLAECLLDELELWHEQSNALVIPNATNKLAHHAVSDKRGRIQLLFLSNLMAEKGVLEFLSAARTLAVRHPHVSFVLAGGGANSEIEAAIRKSCSDPILKDKLEIRGEVVGEEKSSTYLQSDIFVFPSKLKWETVGLVNLEAMSASLPIVASNIGALSEIIVDGVTGYLVPPGDVRELVEKLEMLIIDDRKRAEMGSKARDRYESHYTFDRYRQNVDRAIDHFIKGIHAGRISD